MKIKKVFEREKMERIFNKLKLLVKRNISPFYKLYLLGSYIRNQPIHDMDILILNKNYHTLPQIKSICILKTIIKLIKPSIKEVNSMGNQRSIIVLKNGLKIDLFFYPYNAKVAAKTFLIGSKIFQIILRKKAKEKGYLLNSYGLFKKGRKIVLKNEKQLFQKIGMKWITYPEREKG